MIDAKSLRLGNIVLINGKTIALDGIYPDMVVFGNIASHIVRIEDVQPIELSPSILEKCGFYEVPNKFDIFRTKDDYFQISFGGKNNSLFYIKYQPNEYCYIYGNLYYLHQLQNLMHSLGHELEIKL